jgi:hypothetical protein
MALKIKNVQMINQQAMGFISIFFDFNPHRRLRIPAETILVPGGADGFHKTTCRVYSTVLPHLTERDNVAHFTAYHSHSTLKILSTKEYGEILERKAKCRLRRL